MKKSFLLMGALVVGAAFVSCIDDDESSEVKELRQIQLNKEKKNLDNEYLTMYNNAVDKVKTCQTALKTAQENLDAAKDEKTTLTDVKEAFIAYQQQVIARNQKNIADKEAEITVQKAMAGKTYEEISKAKIEAKNAKEKANKEAADYWIKKTNDGYNLSYTSYNDGTSTKGTTVAVDGAATAKIDMLLGKYQGTDKVKYRNNKLSENEWVKAMNTIFNRDSYSYTQYDGTPTTSNVYTFTFSWDPGSDYNNFYGPYNPNDMFSELLISLYNNNGNAYQTYSKFSFADLKSYKDALDLYINNDAAGKKGLQKTLDDMNESDDPAAYANAFNALAQYKALQAKINPLITILKNKETYNTYVDMLTEYVGFAEDINAFGTELTKATALANAYAAYITNDIVTDNEATIATMQDAIKTYNDNIKAAKKEINEVINNGITDKETAIACYTAEIAELKSQIAANEAIAAKYRALLVGSESSNTQQQQSTPTPEETPAE